MFTCKILADSINLVGDRLTTFEITLPRIILAEFNTHRMLSRNSASSRAIPVEKMMKRVEEDPFFPVYWGKNQKGMQATQELTPGEIVEAKQEWLKARDFALSQAKKLLDLGVHKQITNRIIEPWMWHTVITSATEWQNFFNLRTHKDAQPEIQVIAKMMKEAYDISFPRTLITGEWHLPLIDWDDVVEGEVTDAEWPEVSSGKCARVSYLTHDGKRDPKADLDLCRKLTEAGHMSPMEHAAMALGSSERLGNFTGFKQYRKFIVNEDIYRTKV